MMVINDNDDGIVRIVRDNATKLLEVSEVSLSSHSYLSSPCLDSFFLSPSSDANGRVSVIIKVRIIRVVEHVDES